MVIVCYSSKILSGEWDCEIYMNPLDYPFVYHMISLYRIFIGFAKVVLFEAR